MSGIDQAGNVLANRDLRRFLTGYAATMLGTTMTPVALTFAVLDRGGDAGDVGLVLTAESVPLVLLLLAGGVISDRLPRRWVMVVADVVRACTQALLAVLLITGEPPLGVLMAAAAVLGAGQAFEGPALTALMPEITPAHQLQQANALRGIAESLGRGLGPAIGGVVVAVAGAGWAVGLDAVTYAVSALCLAGLHIAHEPRGSASEASFLGELREGWEAFRSRTWLWVIVAQWSLLCLLVFPAYMVLGAVVADDELGGARAWGLILAGEGFGAVVGGLAMLRLRFHRPLAAGVIGSMAFALPLIALATTPTGMPVAVVAAASVVTGLGVSVFATTWDTTMQRHVEPEALSRVSSYDWFGTVGTLPIGYALVGPISGVLGIDGALWLAVGAWITASLVALAVPSVRHLTDDPDELTDDPGDDPTGPSAHPSPLAIG
ncbi:MAG TPA: MFS transporter [Acidimicrobiales bacterium]|nr:MFS transporter [Acidimicrobiales bacterium]